jgi:hypothetical protein
LLASHSRGLVSSSSLFVSYKNSGLFLKPPSYAFAVFALHRRRRQLTFTNYFYKCTTKVDKKTYSTKVSGKMQVQKFKNSMIQ